MADVDPAFGQALAIVKVRYTGLDGAAIIKAIANDLRRVRTLRLAARLR
ncbi:hypothetical protein [Methylocapsa sp. S129]|nr:hypothetical protein [Methylocapsa sp. S129]